MRPSELAVKTLSTICRESSSETNRPCHIESLAATAPEGTKEYYLISLPHLRIEGLWYDSLR